MSGRPIHARRASVWRAWGIGVATCLVIPSTAAAATPAEPLVVAVVDDAFVLDHAELAGWWVVDRGEAPPNGVDDDGDGRVDDATGWDVGDGDADVRPPKDRLDTLWHGTHLSGVVLDVVKGALGEQAQGAVRLLPVKVLEDHTERPYLLRGYAGITTALDEGADIVLCAWSGPELASEEAAVLDRARREGVLVIAAAGNLGNDQPLFPAAHPAVVSVAAHDDLGEPLMRSSFGGTVDLSAAGWEVEGPDAVSGAVRTESGSSPAAARVAGAAAAVWAKHRDWTADEVLAVLRSTADPMSPTDERRTASVGAGALDVDAALAASPWDTRALWTRSVGDLPLVAPAKEPSAFAVAPPGVVEEVRFGLDVVRGSRRGLKGSRLTILAGRGDDAPVVWEGTLDAFPPEVVSPERRVRVRFTAGRVPVQALLRYRAEPVDVARRWCGEVVTVEAEGVIEDGSGAEPYAPGSACRWQVTAPEGFRVHFAFEQLDTEPLVDQVLFFDGDTTAARMMAGFSGTELPPELTTWGRTVLVWFVTDTKDQRDGWRARVTFVPESTP